MRCPVCQNEWADDINICPICGKDLEKAADQKWVIIGTIEDKMSADLAREALKDKEIPAVIFSRSGFFGDVGLPLRPFYKAGAAAFEVSVMTADIEEAKAILEMILGENWHGKEV